VNSPNQNSSNRLVSPSNVTTAILIGFLFVGHNTDWKMLHGRSSKSARSVALHGFAVSAEAARRQTPDARPATSPAVEQKFDPKSVVADSRPITHDGKSRREID
jgi:hypothetical protein